MSPKGTACAQNQDKNTIKGKIRKNYTLMLLVKITLVIKGIILYKHLTYIREKNKKVK